MSLTYQYVAVDTFGKLDLLWANAGIGVAKTVPQTTLEEWNRVLAVNLTGAFLLAKYGFPELAAGGGGTTDNIINAFPALAPSLGPVPVPEPATAEAWTRRTTTRSASV